MLSCSGITNGAGTPMRNPRSGQLLLFSTLNLFFLFSVMGLSVDLGYSYFKKFQARSAADAAAEAATVWASNNGSTCGAGGVVCGSIYNCASPPVSPPTTALQAGCLYAQANGFTNTGNQSVSLIANNTAPPNESGNSPSYWVQATVTETVPHLFLFWQGFHSGSVAAESIAGLTVSPAGSCVYVLDSGNTADALLVSGNAVLTASGCNIYDNSSNATKAMDVTGSSKTIATQIFIKGGYTLSGTSTSTPAPTTGAPVTADPLGSLPAPSFSGCDHNGYNLSHVAVDTINPGVYCGGISLIGSSQLTMNAGTYILNGGGFNTGNSSIVHGAGVTIFLTGQGGQTPAGMQIGGNSVVTLSAPTSGTYMGILFYQDRSVTYATANLLANSATLNATGSLYFPTTRLNLTGNVQTGKVALVVKDLTVANSCTFDQDLTGTSTGLATTHSSMIQ